MSSEIQELIAKLREAEERRHAASLKAIATLEENMIGSGGPPSESRLSERLEAPEDRKKTRSRSEQSNVDRVRSVLHFDKYLSFEEIKDAAGLNEQQTRAALYAKSLARRLQKKRLHKRMKFRLIPPRPRPTLDDSKGDKLSVNKQVQAILERNPGGLSMKEVSRALPDIPAPAISSALYNLKKRKQTVVHDEETGVYRPKQTDG